MQSKKLEHYKFFTPIAWTVCIGFAGFVGLIAIKASDAIERLETSNLTFEQRLGNIEASVGNNPL